MRRYVVREMKNRKYKNMFGVTDYDIPMFGFKSALLIFLLTTISLFLCVHVSDLLSINSCLPTATITGLVAGFSVAFSQFFIERKTGVCKNFWIVAAIFSFLAFMCIVLFCL